MHYSILSLFLCTTLTSAQIHLNTTIPSPTTSSASAISNTTFQISLTTPIASHTPITLLPTTTCQQTSGTPTPENTPTTTTTTHPHRYNPVVDITITPHEAPLPTSASSLVVDTRELSSGTNLATPGSTGGATTEQEQTEPSGRTTTSGGVVPATTNSALPGDVQNSAKGVRVGGDVAASACALFVAIAALTWAFADLD